MPASEIYIAYKRILRKNQAERTDLEFQKLRCSPSPPPSPLRVFADRLNEWISDLTEDARHQPRRSHGSWSKRRVLALAFSLTREHRGFFNFLPKACMSRERVLLLSAEFVDRFISAWRSCCFVAWPRRARSRQPMVLRIVRSRWREILSPRASTRVFALPIDAGGSVLI